jgi:integrase
MAWFETRGKRKPVHRVRWRDETGSPDEAAFDCLEDAEEWLRLVVEGGGARPKPVVTTTPPVVSQPFVPVGGGPCTFAQWAAYWASGVSGVGDRAAGDYRRSIERDLLPTFGAIDISAIDRTMIGAWVAGMRAKGLSAKSIRNKHGLLHQIFDAALMHEPKAMRDRNPCRRTRLPKVFQSELRPLSPPEFARLKRVIDPRYGAVITFLVATGLRWGEMAGLQVRHVHLLGTEAVGPHLRVEWTLKRDAVGHYVLGRPKTKAAQRFVPLSAPAVDLLIPLIVDKAGTDLVFTTPTGMELRHQNFYSRVWRPAILKAGLGAQPGLPALRRPCGDPLRKRHPLRRRGRRRGATDHPH